MSKGLRFFEYVQESSVTPKTATVTCTVPKCNRSWHLTGGHQGFTLASAQSHCWAHWRRYHKEQNHPKAVCVWYDGDVKRETEGVEFCKICKKVSRSEQKEKQPP